VGSSIGPDIIFEKTVTYQSGNYRNKPKELIEISPLYLLETEDIMVIMVILEKIYVSAPGGGRYLDIIIFFYLKKKPFRP
jgi:hypothetical protein